MIKHGVENGWANFEINHGWHTRKADCASAVWDVIWAW